MEVVPLVSGPGVQTGQCPTGSEWQDSGTRFEVVRRRKCGAARKDVFSTAQAVAPRNEGQGAGPPAADRPGGTSPAGGNPKPARSHPRPRWGDLDASGNEDEEPAGRVAVEQELAGPVSMCLLRGQVEQAIGFQLLGLTLEENGTDAAAEVHLQLPEGGTWSFGIAQAAEATLRLAGVLDGFHVFGWQ